jgi:hypothetical protein
VNIRIDWHCEIASVRSWQRTAPGRTWEQSGNRPAQALGKRGQQGQPESRTNQQDRRPGPVCKTSIPGSNPGGASNLKPHENHELPNWLAWGHPAIWEHWEQFAFQRFDRLAV